ncbi:NUDIX domain-containing protein [Demequina oxidasica]|uniref:NUDIX domain-containing protein n=1 Tax=Demequina oxidasica TaxID=676199 RepID=UPI0009FE5C2D
MTDAPPPQDPNRDPGEAWVEAATGERFWGRFGAAGLLAVDDERGVLMQHRALWSHHGGTWGIPGGALHEGESALAGALREAGEEAGVPVDAVLPFAAIVLDRQVWTYTTVLARVTLPFTPVAGDAESLTLAWVPIDDVESLPLHPAFAASWPQLTRVLDLDYASEKHAVAAAAKAPLVGVQYEDADFTVHDAPWLSQSQRSRNLD